MMPFSLIAQVAAPLKLSLGIALSATVICALVAVPLAYSMVRRRVPLKSAIEVIFTLPLVLPPTVVGYLLLVTFGRNGWIGRFLYDAFGYRIIFRPEAAILASVVVAFPLIYLPTKAAFSAIDREMEDVARLMGASRLQIFWHVAIPLARRGILSGVVLAFARALGEFGATVMVFGTSATGSTLSIQVFLEYVNATPENAIPAVIALLAMSFGLIFLYNRSVINSKD